MYASFITTRQNSGVSEESLSHSIKLRLFFKPVHYCPFRNLDTPSFQVHALHCKNSIWTENIVCSFPGSGVCILNSARWPHPLAECI